MPIWSFSWRMHEVYLSDASYLMGVGLLIYSCMFSLGCKRGCKPWYIDHAAWMLIALALVWRVYMIRATVSVEEVPMLAVVGLARAVFFTILIPVALAVVCTVAEAIRACRRKFSARVAAICFALVLIFYFIVIVMLALAPRTQYPSGWHPFP